MRVQDLFEARVVPDQPPFLYHVSRQSNRTSIQQSGLKPQNVEFTHIHRQPATHGFETLAQARDWAFFFAMDIGEPVDIWRIDVRGMPVKLDPSDEMQEVYDSWVVIDPIPADKLKRVGSMQVHTSTAHAPPLAAKVRPRMSNAPKLDENLRKWFKDKWVRFGPDGKIRGSCARGHEGEGKPKCLPQKKAWALGKKKRATAARRKRREDPNPDRTGAAKMVATKESTELAEKKDACYYKVKSRYKVWPSAYASGALVQCRQKGAKNWGNK